MLVRDDQLGSSLGFLVALLISIPLYVEIAEYMISVSDLGMR
jgi:hypothetical protein